MTHPTAQRARAAIAAVNSRDAERLGPLLAADVEVGTGRTVHRGPDAAIRWAAKEYDYLVRRYEVEEVRIGPRSTLVLGRVEYVWKEGGEVGDSSPIALELEFDEDLLRRLVVHDDARAALLAFTE